MGFAASPVADKWQRLAYKPVIMATSLSEQTSPAETEVRLGVSARFIAKISLLDASVLCVPQIARPIVEELDHGRGLQVLQHCQRGATSRRSPGSSGSMGAVRRQVVGSSTSGGLTCRC
jgi:hypothetical protein